MHDIDDNDFRLWQNSVFQSFLNDLVFYYSTVLFSISHRNDGCTGVCHVIATLHSILTLSLSISKLYGWGDNSRGQLGHIDATHPSTPQLNKSLAYYCEKNRVKISSVASGGYHTLGGIVDQIPECHAMINTQKSFLLYFTH